MILYAEQISKTYRSNGIEVHALKSSNLTINQGTINVVLGRSGSGKSTLLKVLGGLSRTDSGKILIDGQSIYDLNETQLAVLRSRNVGFVFQDFNQISEMSVLHNIRLPFDINRLPYDLSAEDELFDLLRLKERLNFYPDQLSGGERQRVAIARALLINPSIVLADEPTGNLDYETAISVVDLFQTCNQLRHQTMIIVTHDSEWLRIADRVFTMKDGVLTDDDPRSNDNDS